MSRAFAGSTYTIHLIGLSLALSRWAAAAARKTGRQWAGHFRFAEDVVAGIGFAAGASAAATPHEERVVHASGIVGEESTGIRRDALNLRPMGPTLGDRG